VTADTSPLWVGLLVVAGSFTTSLPTAAILLSIAFYVLLAIGVYRASRDLFRLSKGWAVIAGLLTVLSSRLVWSGMSGMETSLAALLVFLSLEEHERNRQNGRIRWREGLWLGLGVATRPEFFFVALVLAVDWMRLHRSVRPRALGATKALVTMVLLSSPTLLLPIAIEGRLVSHSSIVQGAGLHGFPNVGYLWFAAKILASNNIVLAIAIVLCIGKLIRDPQYRLLLIVAIGLPVLQAFVAPQFRHHGRYFFPVIPLLMIVGTKAVYDIFGQRGIVWGRVGVAMALIAAGAETGRWLTLEAEAVRNINDQHLAAAAYLRSTIGTNNVLAVDDVGAVGYYTKRSVIDLTGLVSPAYHSLQRDQRLVWKKARSEGANLFLIYTRLNPDFYSYAKDSLEFVREFRIRKPLVSSADTAMNLYRVKHAD
jgi:hypothetical protein